MKTAPFFEHICHESDCGLADEARFLHAGPHIKQVCNGCGAYVKFFPEHLIPDVEYIKQKIWNIVDADQSRIDAMKKDVEFIEGLSGKYAKLMYWNLYLNLRQEESMKPATPATAPVPESKPVTITETKPAWL